MIADAGGENSTIRRAAIDELCQSYWPPIYAFLRRRGLSPGEAEDVTQDFFAELLDNDRLITTADPSKGKFRTYVIASLKNRLFNQQRYDRAKKRGGDVTAISVDWSEAEAKYLAEPVDHWTAEALFHRRWAITLLEGVLDRLAQTYAQQGRADWFEILRPFLTTSENPPYEVIADQLQTTSAAARVAVCRLRKHYREQLIQEIGSTLGEGEDVASEQAELLKALQGPC